MSDMASGFLETAEKKLCCGPASSGIEEAVCARRLLLLLHHLGNLPFWDFA